MQVMGEERQQVRAGQQARGRAAETPAGIPPNGWLDIAWRIYRGIGNNRIPLTAAGVTYFILLSLVPSLTFFVTIYGVFSSPGAAIDQLELLYGILPPGGVELLRDQLVRLTSHDDQTLGLTLIGSFLIALWTAGLGIKALFQAMNVVYYEREKRGFIHINLLTLAFVFGGTLGVISVLLVVLGMPVALSFIPLDLSFEWLVRVAGYAALALVLLTCIAAIYYWGPSRRQARWHWISPGSVMAVVCILVMSVGFSWYAANFSSYDATYGSLGALIATLTWIWLSMMIIILGGALNSEIEHQTARDTTVGGNDPIGARGAYVADTVGRKNPLQRADKD